VAISAAAVWQYENMRTRLWRRAKDGYGEDLTAAVRAWLPSGWGEHPDTERKRRKAGGWRDEANRIWNSLSEADRLFAQILAANVAVFLAWRVPALAPFMTRYFTANPASRSVCVPMVLSAFSHYSFLHLACNMFVLHGFMQPIIDILGKEQFVGFYLSSAVVSSFVSHLHKVATSRAGMSLGASGAVLGILGLYGTAMPEARLQIIFLPMITFTASVGIKAMIALDTCGIVAGWKIFDHAAHLGGMIFGVWWFQEGSKIIWGRREAIMRWWHENVRNREGKS